MCDQGYLVTVPMGEKTAPAVFLKSEIMLPYRWDRNYASSSPELDGLLARGRQTGDYIGVMIRIYDSLMCHGRGEFEDAPWITILCWQDEFGRSVPKPPSSSTGDSPNWEI